MSNKLGIESIVGDEINITISDDGSDVVLKFFGRIDLQNPHILLTPFFNSVHDKLIDNNIKNIKCDIRELHFINSSGIKCLILWILKIPALSVKNQYNITFIIDNNITWQKNSISFLTALIPDKIYISDKT